MTKAELERALKESEAAQKREASAVKREAVRRKRAEAERDALRARLQESVDQQTATAHILDVISNSPTDVQPVLDVVAENAARVCGATDAVIHRIEGRHLHRVAHFGSLDAGATMARSIDRTTAAGRAVVDRQTIHVTDMRDDAIAAEFPVGAELARQFGHGTILATPLMRDGIALGVILIRRMEVRPFSDQQVAMLKTFADQAVIAIENVRLFTELQARNHDLTESLDRQTATAEILRIISSSPTNVQPVFDTIVRNAGRVCDAVDAVVVLRIGDQRTNVAHWGQIAAPLGDRGTLTRETVSGRAIVDASPVHVEDLSTSSEFPEGRERARALGHRATLAVPLLREGAALGSLLIRRTEPRPFSDAQVAMLQTFADQAVIAIENVRLFTELQEKNRALTEAHAEVTESFEQQTATAEILRVISGSLTDIQPVLDAVTRSAMRLCEAYDAWIGLREGDHLRVLAHHGPIPIAVELRPLKRGRVSETAILDRKIVHVHDLAATGTEFPQGQVDAQRIGHRTTLGVPLMREGEAIGVILIRRLEVRPFTDKQIELVTTFADQAVIAIENVRLFTELQEKNRALTEALDQQTATAEILRVISSSPTDVQPVFSTILRNANRLCDASFSVLWLSDADGGELTAVAHENVSPALAEALKTARPGPHRRHPLGLTMSEHTVVHVPDVLADPRFMPDDVPTYRFERARSIIAVPMLREGRLIGVINAWRREARPFSNDQIELLKTFADQAVIAIENVRLFTELQEKNRAVTEALEQQTATAEILGVISSSPTDVRPVFDAVAENAARLCGAADALVMRVDRDMMERAAHFGGITSVSPRRPITPDTPTGRAIVERRIIHIDDILQEFERGDYVEAQSLQQGTGFRTLLAVPLMRDEIVLGVIVIRRTEVRPFTTEQRALVQTFADQAVIAVENVRLFTELRERTRELARSVDQLTALGEVSRAVSSTLDLDRVLNTVVLRASQLAGADGCSIFEYDDTVGGFRMRATSQVEAATLAAQRSAVVPPGEGAVGRLTETRAPVHIPDIRVAEAYRSPLRDVLIAAGYRALLAVPMFQEDDVVGGLVVSRKAPGEFPTETLELLQTFANQSALAIANARLFREIEEKSAQLEAANRHKSEFLANMSHELRTPLNAIIGFSDVLLEGMFGEINEKQTEYLRDILGSGTHLLSLINDILDLSKIEAGRMELDLTDFDVPQAIDNALTLMRERATRHGIALTHALDDRLGAIRADERKFKQVLLNLLSNAVKFTPEGGKVEIRARLVDDAVEVTVADTGEGIAPEDQAAVFEEFRQVGKSSKKIEGTGLGLALCRKFVELHGGTLGLESQVGVGSTFTFTMPTRQTTG